MSNEKEIEELANFMEKHAIGYPGVMRGLACKILADGYSKNPKSELVRLDSNKATDIFKQDCENYLCSIGKSFYEPDEWPLGFKDFYTALYESLRKICQTFGATRRLSEGEVIGLLKRHSFKCSGGELNKAMVIDDSRFKQLSNAIVALQDKKESE